MELAEVWRYPVKSMRGERLDQAIVGPGGIQGDRRWAVVDAETGVSLSAKRYANLLRCRAWTAVHGIMIQLPDGTECRVDSAEAAAGLTELLEREVTTRSAEATDTIRHEFPKAATEGTGKPFLYTPETEAFFDCAPLQLLTSATLRELQRLLPSSELHQTRFRPNFFIETRETGFIENRWVHKVVTLGSLTCQVYDNTRRCIMVALAQECLPRDTEIIRNILKSNDGCAGVALRTIDTGLVQRGMKVEVLTR